MYNENGGDGNVLSQREIDRLLADQEFIKREGTPEQQQEISYINFLLDKVAQWVKIGSDPDAQKFWNDANMRFDAISDSLPVEARKKLLDRLMELSQGKRNLQK